MCMFSFFILRGQSSPHTSLYLEGQYNQTLSDVSRGNNPWGIGLGLQAFFLEHRRVHPTIEITGDAYLLDDKAYRTYPNGTQIKPVKGVVNIQAGGALAITPHVYASILAGPSFVSGQTLFSFKPSIGVYFTSRKRITAKLSYLNIMNRGEYQKVDFTALSFGVGIKLK
jgi:hypothetical protein